MNLADIALILTPIVLGAVIAWFGNYHIRNRMQFNCRFTV